MFQNVDKKYGRRLFFRHKKNISLKYCISVGQERKFFSLKILQNFCRILMSFPTKIVLLWLSIVRCQAGGPEESATVPCGGWLTNQPVTVH